MRRVALAAGVLYLVTFIASIPALALKGPALDHVNFVLGAGSESSVVWAGFLDVITALACVGTAVVLFSVTRRYSQIGAIGFVASRVVEAGLILVGVVSLLSLVTLRQDVTAADATSIVTVGKSLVAIHNWTFLLGPSLMAAVNALFLGSVMYRSRLVPRIIPTLGLIGAPILLASTVATLFGVYAQTSVAAGIAVLPVFLWELSLGLWLTFKGFNTVPVVAAPAVVSETRDRPSVLV
jgi:hypothetical protein